VSAHPAIDLLATHTGDPLGMDARRILDDLAAKERLVGWLLALVVEQDRRRTTGGVPRPYSASWRNTALPVQVHNDYRGRV
jgi:hypothetical protein